MRIFAGTIDDFKTTRGSGIAELIVDGDSIPCDNGVTCRGFAEVYDDFINPEAHTVNPEVIIGQRIVYRVDDLGFFNGFMTQEEWDDSDGREIPSEGLEDDEDDDDEEYEFDFSG